MPEFKPGDRVKYYAGQIGYSIDRVGQIGTIVRCGAGPDVKIKWDDEYTEYDGQLHYSSNNLMKLTDTKKFNRGERIVRISATTELAVPIGYIGVVKGTRLIGSKWYTECDWNQPENPKGMTGYLVPIGDIELAEPPDDVPVPDLFKKWGSRTR